MDAQCIRAAVLLLLPILIACEPPVPPPKSNGGTAVTPELRLAAPWKLAHQDERGVTVQLANSPHGVYVNLSTTAGNAVGVAPVRDGKRLTVTTSGYTWPLIGAPFAGDALSKAEILVQGVDLIVRLEGPPLNTVTDHPDADDRPLVALVRLRPRQTDWRLVADGAVQISLPRDGLQATAGPEAGWTLNTTWGQFHLETDAPQYRSKLDDSWQFDTSPSIEAEAPYPRSTMTWTPAR